jgi:protein-S-isoprenylcysteine O-methyltransferase Ste14
VAGAPSPEEGESFALDRLRPAERMCVIGAVAVAASLLLPWYGIRFSGGLSVTGLDSFGFAHAALLLTVGSAVALIAHRLMGHTLPRPLERGTLVAVAGAWASLLVAYLMVDRPEELAGSTSIGLRLGAFVAMGGALIVLGAGIRLRRERNSARDV